MKPIKVLELIKYSQEIGVILNQGERYTLLCNGFNGTLKRNKYVCICPLKLLKYSKIPDLDPNTKEIATRWAMVASLYLNDAERQKKEESQKKELEKMQTFFNNLRGA